MARQKNDGRGRLGGRAKGTPNKVTGSVKDWISQVIDRNRQQMERDIEALEPKDRLMMLERLMQYVVPKQKADMEIKQVTVGGGERADGEFDFSCLPTDLLVKVANYILDERCKNAQRRE